MNWQEPSREEQSQALITLLKIIEARKEFVCTWIKSFYINHIRS